MNFSIKGREVLIVGLKVFFAHDFYVPSTINVKRFYHAVTSKSLLKPVFHHSGSLIYLFEGDGLVWNEVEEILTMAAEHVKTLCVKTTVSI